MRSRRIIKNISFDAIIIAIIAIMSFVPFLGFIPLGPTITITIIPIPVIIGTVLMGRLRGLIYGFFFGLFSLLVAMTSGTGFNVFFLNPLVSVLPRVLFGVILGQALYYSKRIKTLSIRRTIFIIVIILTMLLHSIMVYSSLFIIYQSEVLGIFDIASNASVGTILLSLLALVFGFTPIFEAIIATIFSIIILLVVNKKYQARFEHNLFYLA